MQKKFLGFIVLIIISAGLIGCSIMGKNKAAKRTDSALFLGNGAV